MCCYLVLKPIKVKAVKKYKKGNQSENLSKPGAYFG